MSCMYTPAHNDIVACVDSKPTDESVFASASLDGEALIWDTRNEKPATSKLFVDLNRELIEIIISLTRCLKFAELHEGNRIGLTAISWNPHNDNEIVIGAEDGSLTLLDQRQSGSPVSSAILFTRGVHRLLFNPLV